MYYIRTADRLQRTAPWVESFGLAQEFEAAMQRHVDDYLSPVVESVCCSMTPPRLRYSGWTMVRSTRSATSIRSPAQR